QSPPLGPRHWPAWLGVGVMVVAGRLPWPLQRGLGRVLGALAFALARSRRRAASTNLALCFPEMGEAERQRLVRDSFRDLGIGFLEFARAWWGSNEPMRGSVRIAGVERSKSLRADGRGVLLVSGHFMTLEICGRLMCDHLPLAGMYRRYRSPVMEWAVRRGRQRYAVAMFANEDVRAAIRH